MRSSEDWQSLSFAGSEGVRTPTRSVHVRNTLPALLSIALAFWLGWVVRKQRNAALRQDYCLLATTGGRCGIASKPVGKPKLLIRWKEQISNLKRYVDKIPVDTDDESVLVDITRILFGETQFECQVKGYKFPIYLARQQAHVLLYYSIALTLFLQHKH